MIHLVKINHKFHNFQPNKKWVLKVNNQLPLKCKLRNQEKLKNHTKIINKIKGSNKIKDSKKINNFNKIHNHKQFRLMLDN